MKKLYLLFAFLFAIIGYQDAGAVSTSCDVRLVGPGITTNNGWDTSNNYKVNWNGTQNAFYAENVSFGTGEFKVAVHDSDYQNWDWRTYSSSTHTITLDKSIQLNTSGGEGNGMKVPTAGTYNVKITFSGSTPTITVMTTGGDNPGGDDYPKVVLVSYSESSNETTLNVADAKNKVYSLTNHSVKTNNDANRYVLRVYSNASTYKTYTLGGNSKNYWLKTDKYDQELTPIYIENSSDNAFVFGDSKTPVWIYARLDNAGNMASAVVATSGTTDWVTELANTTVLDPLPTKKWKITATSSNPQVFLVGEWLNHSRVTPEYEMKKGADGKYHIDPFMVVPSVEFKVRVYTSGSSYSDYSYNNATATPSNINNASYTWSTNTYTGNGNMKLNLGYSMVSMTFDNAGNHKLEVKLETSYPSTLSFAPIKGHPYMSLQGDATKPLDKFNTPNGHYNGGNKSTDTGWQEGWVQFDEDGNVLVYADGINCGSYGDGAYAGRAMYNTIWPPRNPISFYYKKKGHVIQTASDDLRMKYIGTKKRSEAGTNDATANSDNNLYAVYEVTDIEMDGRYKIWSGWSGCNTNIDGDNSAAWWTSHANWGFGTLDMSGSHSIDTEKWYDMNGAGFWTNNGSRNGDKTDAGGNFEFDAPHLFSKIQFWYPLNGDDVNNTALNNKKSWVITYLAVANPYISIRRSAKTTVTGDYEMRNLPTDGRTVKSYRIYLIKEGEKGAADTKKLVKSVSDGSYDPATIKGTVSNTDLGTGRYKYRFEASYNHGGTVTYEDQAWESPWVRIYGMIQPVITRAEQVTESKFGNTLYSFDIAVEAHAPSTTTDNGSELSDLIKSYKVTFPSITGYDFAASIEAKNSDGTEATTSVSGNTVTVTPDNGNNNAMPSLTFKNVIPGDHKFTVEMLAEDGDTEWPADNVTSASETVEMVVPSMKLDNMRASLNQVAADADMTHIALEERMNVRHGHVREHDTEGSSWENEGKTGYQNNGGYGAHLSRYNRIDAYGDLSTLLVTDGVLTDWDVKIEVVLQDAGAGLDEKYHYTPDASSTINKTANELVISYLPVAMQDKPIADELTIYTDNATAKAQTYHAPAKTIVNYVVTTTYKRKTVTSDVVTATKDESTFTVYNPEKPNDSNVQFGAVTGSFDKPHGIQLEGHSWQKWYNAFNVLDLETGNANGNFAVGFFFTNGTELPVYEPTDPQHKIYPGGHVLDCSINRHNGYTERFYNVFTDAPSATKHFGEMAVDATGYGVDEYGGGGYKSLPLHLGCVYKFDKVTDKPLSQDKLSSFATLEGVLITTHPIVVKPDGNGVRPTVSLMTSDSKTIPFVAAAKNAKAASRALLAIETPSHVEKGFDGATTDLDEVLGDFNTAFRVFPNPAVDVVTVEASAEIGNVEVVASNGATALKAEIRDTNGQLDVSALPAGLYLLRTDAGTTRLIVK